MKKEFCLEIIRGSTSYTIGIDQASGIIGRGPNADIRVPFSTISSAHIEFKANDQGFFFRDLESTNGTFVNGEKIQPHQWIEIIKEATLTVVDTQLIFNAQPVLTPHFTMVQSGTLARKLLMDVLASRQDASDDDAFLEALSGPDSGGRLTLHDGIEQLEIGSATGQFSFPPMTSAVLATVIRDGDGFAILPKETILIDSVATSTRCRLAHGIELEMGNIRFRFTDPLEAYFSEIDNPLDLPEVKIDPSSTDFSTLDKTPEKLILPHTDLAQESNSSSSISENKKTSKKKDWLLIVVILTVVLAGVAVVYGVLSL